MCCPSIIERPSGQVVALGSGGSSRIPTAVVHGARYLVDHDWSISDAVRGPRTHVENGVVHVESDGRTGETMTKVAQAIPTWFGSMTDHVLWRTTRGGYGPDGFDERATPTVRRVCHHIALCIHIFRCGYYVKLWNYGKRCTAALWFCPWMVLRVKCAVAPATWVRVPSC